MILPEIKYVAFPRSAAEIFGTRQTLTRIYNKSGIVEEYRVWLQAIADYVGLVLSSGEAANYVGVTPAAVWKRMTAGKLTAFNFELHSPVGKYGKAEFIESVDACLPFSELQQWRELRQAHQEERARLSQEEAKRMECEEEETETAEERAIRENEERIERERIEFEESLASKKGKPNRRAKK